MAGQNFVDYVRICCRSAKTHLFAYKQRLADSEQSVPINHGAEALGSCLLRRWMVAANDTYPTEVR